MTATLIPNNRASRDAKPPKITVNDDGTPVAWRMFYDNNSRVADANTTAELIDVLIPGYLDMDETQQLTERIKYLLGAQTVARINVATSLTAEEEDALTPVERRALFSDDANPSYVGDLTDPTSTQPFVWSHTAPLFILDAFYPPFGDRTPPLSSQGDYKDTTNVIRLESVTEEGFLNSLTILGDVTFGRPSANFLAPAALRRKEQGAREE